MTTPDHDVPMLLLARVSDGGRAKLLAHVDTALLPHLEVPGVREIYRQVKDDVRLLQRGAEGEAARVAAGFATVHAGEKDLGVRADRRTLTVLFLTASAAERDDRAKENAFVQVMQSLLEEARWRGSDPHAPAATRPRIVAPVGDRLVRDEELGWSLFNAALQVRAVFLVGDEWIDTCTDAGRRAWRDIVAEGSSGRTGSVRRLISGELNMARAGLYPHPETQLPTGYRFQQEQMPGGQFRRAADSSDRTTVSGHVEPDPEAWWQVQALIAAALDPDVTTWRKLAACVGRAGITGRTAEEWGVPIQDLQDPTRAVQLLLNPRKLAAYRTGTLPYTRRGPGGGIWDVPGGHRFHPRSPEDQRGAITYDIELGHPEWPRGFSDSDLDAVMAKWWPHGHAKAEPVGRAATSSARRPLAGLLAWADASHRYEVMAHSGRYELRGQLLATARRTKRGTLADLRHEDAQLIASWAEAELAREIADTIEDAVEHLLTDAPDLQWAVPRVALRHPDAEMDQSRARRDRALLLLRQEVADAEKSADEREALAGMLARSGRPEAIEKFDEAQSLRVRAAELREQADSLALEPLPTVGPVPGASLQLNVSTPAAVVAALQSSHGTGPQPKELNDALRRYLQPGRLRIARIAGDSLHTRLVGTVQFEVQDGRALTVQVDRLLPSRVAGADASLRIHDLARLLMRDALPLEEVAVAARSRNPRVLRRQLTEYLGAGQRRPGPDPVTHAAQPFVLAGAPIPNPGLRAAAVEAIPVARRGVWAVLTGEHHGNLSPGYLALLREVYTPSERTSAPRWGNTWARPSEARYRALAVVGSLPGLHLRGMRTDHLAACIGVPTATVRAMSTRSLVNRGWVPASLARVGGWGGRRAGTLDANQRRVTIATCTHRTPDGLCGGPLDALVAAPEVTHCGTHVLCSRCGRAPGRAEPFPTEYLAWAHESLSRYAGRWVPCARAGCQVDFGAGRGLMWQWATDQDRPAWHGPGCSSPTSISAGLRFATCALPGCTVDEGHGPGVLANAGRSTRKWHGVECQRRARSQAKPTPAAIRCARADCALDEHARTARWMKVRARG